MILHDWRTNSVSLQDIWFKKKPLFMLTLFDEVFILFLTNKILKAKSWISQFSYKQLKVIFDPSTCSLWSSLPNKTRILIPYHNYAKSYWTGSLVQHFHNNLLNVLLHFLLVVICKGNDMSHESLSNKLDYTFIQKWSLPSSSNSFNI